MSSLKPAVFCVILFLFAIGSAVMGKEVVADILGTVSLFALLGLAATDAVFLAVAEFAKREKRCPRLSI
ncbi:hypothetical protein JKG47_01030 [Acidithiobacillus sp. MC6.1]|nr:hypothetical protein [Acidithiobacillus sp. MC6.1]